MASSLVKHKRINTTVAKAKALRSFIEPLITKAKSDTTHSRRTVFKYLKDKYAVTELFRGIAPKIVDRNGGYTRILKTGNRLGDNADMCFIELVDFNEARLTGGTKSASAETKKRTRRGRVKKQTDTKDQAVSQKEDKLVEDAQIVDEASVDEKKSSSNAAAAEDSNKKSENKDDN